MAEHDKQHIVPQAYLKRFTFSKKEPLKVYTMKKADHKIFPANISDSAEENNFYTMPNSDDPFYVEKHFSDKVEPILSNVISEIEKYACCCLIQNYSVVLTDEMKENLVYSIVNQLIRDNNARDLMKRVIERSFEPTFYSIRSKYPLTNIEITDINKEEFARETSILVPFNAYGLEKVVDELRSRIYVIGRIIDDDNEFITSDSPVMVMNYQTLDVTPFNIGINSINAIILYPITPKLIVMGYHRLFKERYNIDGRISFFDNEEKKMLIIANNKKQLEHCYRFVYSRKREILEEISRLP